MNDWRLVHGRLLWHTADLTVTIDALGGPSAAAPAVSPPRPGLGIRYGDAWAQDLGQGVYLLRFENSLGATVLRFRGAPVPPLAVEVLTRKLGDAADPVSHVALYRRLVADVLAALITLPFAVSGATGHTTEREGAPAGPLFTLHFFLRHGRALAAALQAIDYAPHRVLTREELLQPVARARSVATGALRAVLTRSHDWAEHSGDQPGWFRRDGRSYLPFRMYLERSEETFDTSENRFVKHFLRLLLRATGLARRALELASAGADPRALAQAHNILGILARSRQETAGSRQHLEQSLAIAQGLGDLGAQAAALNNLALVCSDSHDVAEAIRLAERALALCRQHGDLHRTAALYSNLADLYHAAGQSDRSMEYFTQSAVLLAQIGAEAATQRPEIWKLTEW